jgi:1-acyl-sn-glycerol-3-phosphate acyltransferase
MGEAMMRGFLAALLRLASGVRLRRGPLHDGECAIFYANHTSHLDFALLWAVLPREVRERTSPVAAEDYWDRRGLRRWIAKRVFKAVLIPREGINRTNNPVERIGAVLGAGRSVIIFPEGTRSADGRPGEFRSGIYHLVRRFPALPLVPVYLENLNRIMPKGMLLPVPLIARVSFRPPIHFCEGEEKNAFLARARAALFEKQPA